MKCFFKCMGTLFFGPAWLIVLSLFFFTQLIILPFYLTMYFAGCTDKYFSEIGQPLYNYITNMQKNWRNL